jgi:hypothetical protein
MSPPPTDTSVYTSLRKSCSDYKDYPKNLRGQNLPAHRIEAYMQRFWQDKDRMFDEARAKMTVLECFREDKGKVL